MVNGFPRVGDQVKFTDGRRLSTNWYQICSHCHEVSGHEVRAFGEHPQQAEATVCVKCGFVSKVTAL